MGLEGVRSLQLMTGYDVGAIQAGRHSNDGLDDLVVSSTSTCNLTVVANTGGTPDASGYAGPIFVPTSAYSVLCPFLIYTLPNQATPLVHDFDLDGDVDIGLPVMGASTLWIDRQVFASHIALAPRLESTEVVNPVQPNPNVHVGVSVPGSTRKLDILVSVPPPAAGGWWSSNPNRPHSLEITIWSHDPSNPFADPKAEARRIDIPAVVTQPFSVVAPPNMPAVPGNTVNCPQPTPCPAMPLT